jgi:PAS domain-containing protein
LAEGIVDTVREPLIVLDGTFKVVSASRSFYRDFQVKPEDTVGRSLYELGNRQWDIPALRELLETILPRDRAFEGYVVDHDFPAIGHRSCCSMRAASSARPAIPSRSFLQWHKGEGETPAWAVAPEKSVLPRSQLSSWPWGRTRVSPRYGV